MGLKIEKFQLFLDFPKTIMHFDLVEIFDINYKFVFDIY